ncbi:hypothetical protein MMC25_001762 [Agyrium rufum]|nr:hypothetical protein [Agyrium rufum]
MAEVITAGDGAVANMGRRMSEFQWNESRRGTVTDFQTLIEEAEAATAAEHQMGIWTAIKTYPKAVGWSVLASTALVMEGYDLVVIGSFYGFPTFQKKYGVLAPDGVNYIIPAAWQSGLSNGAVVGEILGLIATGIIADRMGYKFTIGLALILVICFIFITFFAVNIEMLLVGEILCGLPWGVFQTITTAYAAEVTPVALRPYLCTYVNLCWVFGQLVGSGVLRGLLDRIDQWGYRIPFALQWMWPIPLLIGICLAPESPWWLVRQGRLDDAEHALRRLTSRNDPNFKPQATIAMMLHTDELEKEASAGTSYFDCFRGSDLRRTEIACMTWMIQTFCGSGLGGYSVQFYEQAGLSTTYSFDLQMVQYALGAVGTVLSWFLMGKYGRRDIYLWGLIILDILLITIGLLGIAPSSNHPIAWAVGSLLLIHVFVYDLTVGPVCYSLVAEISSTRLRSKTIVIARDAYNVIGIFNNIITPRMLSPAAFNWGPKAALFWAGFCTVSIVWTYFRLPEPKGKTYAEMDVLFEQKVSARKFKNAKVDPFRGETMVVRNGSVVGAGSVSPDEKSDSEKNGPIYVEKI